MRVFVTDHAARRYIDRVKTHYEPEQAKQEIVKLCETGQPLDLKKYPYLRSDRTYIELSDGIFAPLVKIGDDTYRVLTLMIRGGYEEGYRTRKNSRNQDKRYRRGRKHRQKGHYDRHLVAEDVLDEDSDIL